MNISRYRMTAFYVCVPPSHRMNLKTLLPLYLFKVSEFTHIQVNFIVQNNEEYLDHFKSCFESY